MRSILTGAVVLAFWASPAVAQDTQEPAEATEETSNDDEIVVTGEIDEDDIERCRYVQVTGTRFRERVCMSQNDLDEQRQNHRDVINDNRYEGAPISETDSNGFPVVPPI
ncbi:hypothetical protein [Aurantiacibacter sp. D1-12]|uniref:hypothetical protein n=1 Tax=Aurantiacibacter sp. D1-12 TaxID=2993658 RepID=UPI00237C76A1|nr:hypothetical protein [Aurantiacibacter sp. D1-12]MDE1466811.1 hypothetical protein [Aurantiacibacter sp. D1-12]